LATSSILEAPPNSSRYQLHETDEGARTNGLNEFVESRHSLPEGTAVPAQDQPAPVHSSVINSGVSARERADTFRVTSKWEGLVVGVDIKHCEFEARLLDLHDRALPEEIATFSMDDISEDDLPLVVAGGIFYWFIGYHTSRQGQVTRQSLIRFRRLPTITRGDIRRIQERTKELSEILGLQ